jgi:phospholipid/cholesterol/gamma-HCH transport system substrate-binding protein
VNRDQRNYAVVGAFVLAMVAALIVGIWKLSGGIGPSEHYFVLFDNVMGLKEDTRIYFQGHPVGLIDRISRTRDDEGRLRYRVDVRIERELSLPEDSEAEITAHGLLSSLVIDIRGGSSPTPVEPGGQIRGVEAGMFAKVTAAADRMTALIDDLREPVEAVRKQAPRILENVESLTSDLGGAATQLNSLLQTDNVDSMGRTLANLESSTGSLADASSDLRATRDGIDRLLARLNGLLDEEEGDLARSLAELQYSLETVARHIDAIAQNLEGTTRNMNEFSRQIRENPGVFLRGRETGDGAATP